MNVLKRSIILGGCVAALTLGINNHAMAQGRFDPEQMRQNMIDRAQDQLEITNDDDWKAIEPLVAKVFDARRDVMAMQFGGMFGRGGPRRGGDDNNNNGDNPRPRRNPFGEPSASITALRAAIDNKAADADLKAKMAAVRAETKEKQAKLDAAMEDLRGVLTVRQEAIAVSVGLLK
jgi:hypothetical protein